MNGWGQGPSGNGQPGWGGAQQGQGWAGAPQGQGPGPQQGWGGQAPGGFAQAAGHTMSNPELTKIESDGQTWLIVACVGWFFGVVFITGPLAWYMGSQLEQRCEAMGAPVPSNVKNAKVVGMISTILCAVIFVGIMLMMLFMFGLVAASV